MVITHTYDNIQFFELKMNKKITIDFLFNSNENFEKIQLEGYGCRVGEIIIKRICCANVLTTTAHDRVKYTVASIYH